MNIGHSVRHNLTHLLRFSGRDGRATFWPYAGIVGAITIVALQVVAMRVAQQFADRFAQTDPDEFGFLFTQMFQLAWAMVRPMTGVLALAWLVLAAAMARRLRDRGVTPWLVLVPVVLFAGGMLATMALLSPMLDAAETRSLPGMAEGSWGIVFVLSGLLDLAYNVSLIVMVVLLAQQSRPPASPTAKPS